MRFFVLDRQLRELAVHACIFKALDRMKGDERAECVVRESDGSVMAWRKVVGPVSLTHWFLRLERSVA